MKTESMDMACKFLRMHGYEILDRGIYTLVKGHRRSIDLVAYDRMFNVVVGIKMLDCTNPIVAKCYRKYVRKCRQAVRDYAARTHCWCVANGWKKDYRCDTIALYSDGCIDHITGQTKGANT